MSITVYDVVCNNNPDSLVKVQGINPDDDCDPFVEVYFEGLIKDIPEDIIQCEVLDSGWLLGAACHCINISRKI